MSTVQQITVTWGEETFSPIPFNSFRTGPFSLTTTVRDDESTEQAFDRAWAFLDAYARKQYVAKRAAFLERYHHG